MRLRDRSERLSTGDKIALTIVIVIALLILLALFGFVTGRWSDEANAAQAPPISAAERNDRLKHTCITDDEARERLRGIMFEALDDGLRDQLKKLFAGWMTDDRGQPERARVGVSQAFRAHQVAKQLAIEWAPPLCQ